jgi:hypothetical protein
MMPIHDWTRVDAGIFHHFHLSWIDETAGILNSHVLPRDYYALAEQITGSISPDVLTLSRPVTGSLGSETKPSKGGIAVASRQPKARFHARTEVDLYAGKAKAIVIRHRSGHQVIAMVEIVSPGNRSNQTDAAAFIFKASQALLAGIHLLIVDLFPPNPRAPHGIHRAIWGEGREGDFALPVDKPLTCVSYVGCPGPEVFLEPVAVGDELPKMALFLSSEMYVLVPLEQTYRSAWQRLPSIWQDVLTEAKPPGNGRGKSRRKRD